MSPIQDVDPNVSPTADGTWKFYRQGDDPGTRGVQIGSDGSVTATGSVTAGADGIAMPPGMFLPEDHGLAAWTHDPYGAASSSIAVNGTVYLIRLPVRRDVTVDTIHWAVTTAATTPTAGQNEVGLYSAAGTRLAAVNVDSDTSSSGSKESTITAQALTAGTYVYAAFLFNAATPPTLLRGSSFESSPSINLAASAGRAVVAATGQTTLPASVTPGTFTFTNNKTYFAGLEAA